VSGRPGEIGWVFYDGECSLCVTLAERSRETLRRGGFELVPLQARGVGERLRVAPEVLMTQMWVLARDGRVLGGADACVYLAREIRSAWWARVLMVAAALPGGTRLLRWGYRWVAEHRHRFGGTCALRDPGTWPPRGDADGPPTRSSPGSA
jgi:predicted DCC family thiol-disulfide oxidoreductase YuxK